ncbi:MAG: hypothetical protein QXO71_07575 [Candidatus Jordarchaeaceae archaeon]
MRKGSSFGAVIFLCLSIVGFVVFLFIFWPLAFAILFGGIAIFCLLQPAQETQPSQPPRGEGPVRYEPKTQPQRISRKYAAERPVYYQLSGKRQVSRARIPIEQSENKTRDYGLREKPETSKMGREPMFGEETSISTVKRIAETKRQEKDLETSSKYGTESTTIEKREEMEPKTAPKQAITIQEKAESIKELESEEEANRAILEELKRRWMSGQIDLETYQRLKEKYEKKIRDIQKQKKQI